MTSRTNPGKDEIVEGREPPIIYTADGEGARVWVSPQQAQWLMDRGLLHWDREGWTLRDVWADAARREVERAYHEGYSDGFDNGQSISGKGGGTWETSKARAAIAAIRTTEPRHKGGAGDDCRPDRA